MGILDQILAQLSGRGAPDVPYRRSPGGGISGVAMALLPIVLRMLASRSAGRRFGSPAGGGGLGDILGRGLGAGGALAGGIGLPVLLEQFRRAGYSQQTDSWVSTGPNMPIPPRAVEDAFGREGIEQIAREAGLSEQETASGLSELLPEVVDRVTPAGEIPDLDSLGTSVDELGHQLGIE